MAQATYPDVQSLEGAPQRLQLADGTAAVAALNAVIEQVDAFFLHHLLHLMVVGEEDFYLYIICKVGAVDELVGLRKQPAGVKGEDACLGIDLHYHVRKHLVLYRQRR